MDTWHTFLQISTWDILACSYGTLSLCSDLEAADQPEASAQAERADGEERMQLCSAESINLNEPPKPTAPPQNKGEIRTNVVPPLTIILLYCYTWRGHLDWRKVKRPPHQHRAWWLSHLRFQKLFPEQFSVSSLWFINCLVPTNICLKHQVT